MLRFINAYKTAIQECQSYIETMATVLMFPMMWLWAVVTGQTVTAANESQAAVPQTPSICNDNLYGKVTTETYTYEDQDGNTVTVTSTTTWGKEEYIHQEAFNLLADSIVNKIENEMKK